MIYYRVGQVVMVSAMAHSLANVESVIYESVLDELTRRGITIVEQSERYVSIFFINRLRC